MIKKNSDIQNIKFLGNIKNVKIEKDWLIHLKKVSKKKIDKEAFDLIISDIDSNKLEFIVGPQEQNYLKSCKEENILEYLLYRFKFKEFPKRKISSDFPIYILIEPVSSCNLKCSVCFQSDASFIKKEFMGKMDFDLYKKVIDEAAANGTKAITFGSRGEPTIHPQIIDFIDYAKNKFLEFKLITNATKLDDKLIHKIFQSNIDLVQFSIDSEDKKIYEKIRKFANFEKVLANVKRYCEIKKDYKNCKTVTRVSGLKVYDEQSEEGFHKFWGQYADEIVFKKVAERWDTYNNKLNEDLLKPCRFIWERMYVWFDGKINPCDADYKSYLSYGNVNKQSIKEIWNSKPFQDLKKTHLNNQRNKLTPCDRCGQA